MIKELSKDYLYIEQQKYRDTPIHRSLDRVNKNNFKLKRI